MPLRSMLWNHSPNCEICSASAELGASVRELRTLCTASPPVFHPAIQPPCRGPGQWSPTARSLPFPVFRGGLAYSGCLADSGKLDEATWGGRRQRREEVQDE